jgi:hypothetical protein
MSKRKPTAEEINQQLKEAEERKDFVNKQR